METVDFFSISCIYTQFQVENHRYHAFAECEVIVYSALNYMPKNGKCVGFTKTYRYKKRKNTEMFALS